MDDEKSMVPVVVTMRVACGCGHAEDETYEFDVPADKAKPMEELRARHMPGVPGSDSDLLASGERAAVTDCT